MGNRERFDYLEQVASLNGLKQFRYERKGRKGKTFVLGLVDFGTRLSLCAL